MVKRINDTSNYIPLHEEPDQKEGYDYEIGEGTGVGAINLYVDKSQHIAQYTFNIVNTTGQKLPTSMEVGSGLTKPRFILETEVANKLFTTLNEIEEVLDDPGLFEQKLSSFFGLLDGLEDRKEQREVYFSDLLGMLKMALVKIEHNELTQSSISALREAISCLGGELTEEKLKYLRGRFRECGIDLLKPFKSNIDVKNILKEIYPNEITT